MTVLACLSLGVGAAALVAVPLPFAGYGPGARADLRRWSAPLADAAARFCQSLRATGAGLALLCSLSPDPLKGTPMTDRTMPVDGPFRVTVTSTPTGAELDLSAFLEHVIMELAGDLLPVFEEIAEVQASATHSLSYGNSDASSVNELDTLVQDLADRLPKLPVYGRQTIRLGERLVELGTQATAPTAVTA